MNTAFNIKLGKYTFATSLTIGSILLILLLYGINLRIIVGIGLYYVLIAAILNLIILVYILINAIVDSTYRYSLLSVAALMLINIPIAIAYFYIVINTI